MSVTLSIENVPDEIVAALRLRAARNHRSLQQELLIVLHEATSAEQKLSPKAALSRARAAGIKTATDSAAIIRRDRDAH